jgi:hypothetical protein
MVTREGDLATGTPEQVLESVVAGINSGNLDGLMHLYESEAAFATQPGSFAHGASGIGDGASSERPTKAESPLGDPPDTNEV